MNIHEVVLDFVINFFRFQLSAVQAHFTMKTKQLVSCVK